MIKKSQAFKATLQAWVEKQSEPFNTDEVRGRFGLCGRTATKYLQMLVADGVIRCTQTTVGVLCVYERVARNA